MKRRFREHIISWTGVSEIRTGTLLDNGVSDLTFHKCPTQPMIEHHEGISADNDLGGSQSSRKCVYT